MWTKDLYDTNNTFEMFLFVHDWTHAYCKTISLGKKLEEYDWNPNCTYLLYLMSYGFLCHYSNHSNDTSNE